MNFLNNYVKKKSHEKFKNIYKSEGNSKLGINIPQRSMCTYTYPRSPAALRLFGATPEHHMNTSVTLKDKGLFFV